MSGTKLLVGPIDSWSSWAFTALLLAVVLGAIGAYYDQLAFASAVFVAVILALAVAVAVRQRRPR